ncbi:MAG: DNA phosphorothioation-dependent restriction protein DptF [Pseudomonadota bacterium]
MLRLKDALSVFDKSSPYAVSTDTELNDPELNDIKKYFYIETEIEKAFVSKLSQLKNDEILFLCGSSGDGKSELLTRHNECYKKSIDFHLDATHSFEPHSTAIDTLNDLFSSQKEKNRPLVVGINIGMLGNFSEEGSTSHETLKANIKSFLKTKNAIQKQCYFIDFESFPKFDLNTDSHTSDFIQQILFKLTDPVDSNPFFVLYEQERKDGDEMLSANFRLLSIKSVQSIIIDLLLKARLVKDQFITARALLDFIYYLVTGPKYLFDNLFNEDANELVSKVSLFDPCSLRRKNIDIFILQRKLELLSSDYGLFSNELLEIGIDCNSNYIDHYSLVRLFYILKDYEFSNNYHLTFKQDFDDCLIDKYATIWGLHASYDGSKNEKQELKSFYKDIVLVAINKYANRNASNLNKDEFFISSHNNLDLTVELELTVSYSEIKKIKDQKISFFMAYMKVEDKALPPIPISINMLNLMMKIVQGYRPNKHDKNTVVLLDEIVCQIIEEANKSNVLYLHTGSSKIKIKKIDEDDIEVSGGAAI